VRKEGAWHMMVVESPSVREDIRIEVRSIRGRKGGVVLEGGRSRADRLGT